MQGSRCEDGNAPESNRGPTARRPADVYIPSWDLGGAAAFDFAITSGMRTDMLASSAANGAAAAIAYEQVKRSFLDTESRCREEGLSFVPIVMEAHSGTWGPTARKVWRTLAKAISTISGEDADLEAERCLQSLSVTLHRETARSILRRAGPGSTFSSAASSAQILAQTVELHSADGHEDEEAIGD